MIKLNYALSHKLFVLCEIMQSHKIIVPALAPPIHEVEIKPKSQNISTWEGQKSKLKLKWSKLHHSHVIL